MSYTELSCKTVVNTKKVRCCSWCGEKIQIGEKAVCRAYIFEGSFLTDRMHPECDKAMHNSASELSNDDGGFEFGEFRRGMTVAESANAEYDERRAARGGVCV